MKVRRSAALLLVVLTSAAAAAHEASVDVDAQPEDRPKSNEMAALRGGRHVNSDGAEETRRLRLSDDVENSFAAEEDGEKRIDDAGLLRHHHRESSPYPKKGVQRADKRKLGKNKANKNANKNAKNNNKKNKETRTNIHPDLLGGMELAQRENKLFTGGNGGAVVPVSEGGDVTSTGGGVTHQQDEGQDHQATPKTTTGGTGGSMLGQDIVHAENGQVLTFEDGDVASTRTNTENKLAIGAPTNGFERVPIPGVGSSLETLENRLVPGTGLVVQPQPAQPQPQSQAQGGTAAATGAGGGGTIFTGTGDGVVHTNENTNGVSNRGDPCADVPDSLRGTIPSANTPGKSIFVEAPTQTWSQCDVMCQGYPDACAHKGYFWTPDQGNANIKRLVRACMNLKGLSSGARTGCQQGKGDSTRDVAWTTP